MTPPCIQKKRPALVATIQGVLQRLHDLSRWHSDEASRESLNDKWAAFIMRLLCKKTLSISIYSWSSASETNRGRVNAHFYSKKHYTTNYNYPVSCYHWHTIFHQFVGVCEVFQVFASQGVGLLQNLNRCQPQGDFSSSWNFSWSSSRSSDKIGNSPLWISLRGDVTRSVAFLCYSYNQSMSGH